MRQLSRENRAAYRPQKRRLKMIRLFLVLFVFLMLMSGCESSQKCRLTGATPVVSLGAIGSSDSDELPLRPRSSRSFHLGAGDALGQAIYANYAAIARANAGWQYAGTLRSE